MRYTATIGETITAEDLKDADIYKQQQPPTGDMALFVKCVAVAQQLRSLGFPERVLAYCIAQTMLETGNYTSDLCIRYNNYSGIRPNKHGFTNGTHNGFATYASITDWARDYQRVLSMGARPIDGTTAQDFFTRLQKNGYFTAKEAPQYSKSINAAIHKYQELYAAYGGKILTQTKDPQTWWSKLPWYAKGGAILAGVVVLKKVID